MAAEQAGDDRAPAAAGAVRLVRFGARTLLLLAALGVLGWAQVSIAENGALFAWPGEGWLDERFERAFLAPNTIAFALPLLVAGGVLFALVARPPARPEGWPPISLVRPGRVAAAAVAVALASCLAIIGALFADRYYWLYPAFFFGGLIVAVAALLACDWRTRRFALRRPSAAFLIEAALVLALVGTFVGINVRDLDSWQYMAIGDEGPFYSTAKSIFSDSTLNWFSQLQGAYNVHPVLSSVWHAVNMLIFGDGLFGWKMGSLSAIALTLPVFYLLLRELTSARTALFGTMFLAASHYLFSYAHTSYNNIFPLFPTVVSLLFLSAGLRRGRPSLLVLAGIAAGLGFYTFYSSRVVIAIIGLALLTLPDRRTAITSVGLVGAGFAVAVLPLFATDGWAVVSEGNTQSIFNSDIPFWEHLGYNVVRSLFAFNFNPGIAHYTAGALLDGLSAVFAMAGLALAVRRVSLFSSRLVLIWFVVAITVTGFLSLYTTVTITRLHYALPPLAAFAGMAADELLAMLREASGRRLAGAAATGLGLAVLAPAVFIINGRQFFEYSAGHHITIPESAIMRALTSDACRDASLRDVVHMPDAAPVLDGEHQFFGLERRKPLELSFLEPDAVFGTIGLGGGTGCVVAGPIERAPELVERLGPEARLVTDRTGVTRIALLPASAVRGPLRPAELAQEWPGSEALEGVFRALPRDALPALDGPDVLNVQEYPLLEAFEPVLAVSAGGQRHAYPLRYLAWHGVVNDEVGGTPVVITYDPFGGVARAYARQAGSTFAYSGLMRQGDALIYDRESESLWQQMSGRAVAGPLAGERLTPVESAVVAWREFVTSWPEGDVLTVSPDDPRYGRNPLLSYDSPDARPIFTSGPLDTRLPAMRRVAVIELDGRTVAVPFPEDVDVNGDGEVVAASIGSQDVLLFFNPLTRSSVDTRGIGDSKLVGSVVVYERGDLDPEAIVVSSSLQAPWQATDTRAATRYDFFAKAPEGQALGLRRVEHFTGFWFSVSANYPGIELLDAGLGE